MLANTLDFPDDSRVVATKYNRRTRVLIVSDHPGESRDVAKNLLELKLDVQLSLFDGNTLSSIPTKAPDAVLCHLVDYPAHGPKLARVVRAQYRAAHLPVIGAMSRPSADATVGFDSTLFAPMHASQIANRVNSMIRLGVMEAEIIRRQETLQEDFDQTPEIGELSPDRKLRVLFIGKAAPSFMVIVNALQDKGVEVTAAFTSFSAFDYLHGDPFDAVVMNTLKETEPAFSIAEAMRRNSKLYHTPTLFLVNGHSFTEYDAAYERGARDIIDQDADSEEISGRILELANYHRVHEQLKADYSTLSMKAAGDQTGTAYSQKFLRAHLPRVLQDASNQGVPVTLLGLKLNSMATGEVKLDAIDLAYGQIAKLLSNLVRMQDIVCRWDDDIFVLAFYDTDVASTKIILQRITALLDCTVYDSGLTSLGALNVSAQSTVLQIDANFSINQNHLERLISTLYQDPDDA